MTTITLDGSNWKAPDDFYDAFFEAVGAPKWHGRNFNALRDSIVTGQINRVELPYAVHIRGVATMPPSVRKITEDFCDLIREFRSEGYDVSAECHQ
jgi:RNAse (barnase) inhibitor barstar